MSDLPPARALRRPPLPGPCHDAVVLRYDERLLRRRRLVTAKGGSFLVDLPATVGLSQGDALELEDGRLIEVIAAAEPLLEVRGDDLPRLAWHLGNRHAPCQIEPERLLIGRDHVLRDLLLRLGAEVRDVSEPFDPEGGAYGEGRVLGHDHSHAQDHDHRLGVGFLGHSDGHGH